MQADRITAGIVLSCLLAEDDKTSVDSFRKVIYSEKDKCEMRYNGQSVP